MTRNTMDIVEDSTNKINEKYRKIALIVKEVNEELFTNQEVKDEFENLFHNFGESTFTYLHSFKRVIVSFSNCENALEAKLGLDNKNFHGKNLKISFKEEVKKLGEDHLPLPKQDKLFLLSPPASPPVGWTQKVEPLPVINLDLLAAVAEMQMPGEPIELISQTANTPSICVVGCDMSIPRDGQKQMINIRSLPRSEVQTKRPPLSQ